MWNFDYNLNNLYGLNNNFGWFNPCFNMFMPSFFNPFNGFQNYSFPSLFNFSNPYVMPAYNANTNTNNNSASNAPAAQTNAPKAKTGNVSADRIIEHNRTNYGKDYYGIVDKKNCKLTIYDKNGNAVKSYILGLGEDKGDGIAHNGKGGHLTTAGEFTLDENVNLVGKENYQVNGQYRFMALNGDNASGDNMQAGIHMIPKNLQKKRLPWMDSKTLDDNRMSLGCVNMYQRDYEDMYNNYLQGGCKIYILPEEAGNELVYDNAKSKFVVKHEQQRSNNAGSQLDYAA